MEIGSIKSRDNAARAGYRRPGATVRAEPTELAPSQSVTATAPAATSRNGATGETPAGLIDPQNRELADRERENARRGVRRPPDQTLQVMQAYHRTPPKNDNPDQDGHADIEA